MWSWSTNVTDRQTGRRTTCNLNTALSCTSASRGNEVINFMCIESTTVLVYIFFTELVIFIGMENIFFLKHSTLPRIQRNINGRPICFLLCLFLCFCFLCQVFDVRISPYLCTTGERTWLCWGFNCCKWFICRSQTHLWFAKRRCCQTLHTYLVYTFCLGPILHGVIGLPLSVQCAALIK